MSNAVFPNGDILESTAATPDTINVIFQPLIASILSIDPVANPNLAYSAVRVGWPQTGQPAWAITDDVCVIRATPVDDPYSRVRDNQYAQLNPAALTQNMGFTQVWNLHCTLYGPNAYDHARLILSAMSLDWVHDQLASSNLYGIVKYHRPTSIPELFQGQWWKRSDIDMQFNEQVFETLIVPAAASVDVELIVDDGFSETITID